ncbi:MAG: T9SS type A sorting domain-containing protein, partial [Flavobacteriaceae bacterium]|nr:T9SS type A sorting domain-containing protein [Flavobacteriaceae bacterium]
GNANGNNAPEPTQMIGLFICEKVHGNTNVVWNADPLCDPCAPQAPNNPPPSIEENFGTPFKVKAWPNPAETDFNLKVLSTNSEARISISVYDMSNKLVFEDTFNFNDEYKFGEKLDSGVYIVKITQGDQSDVLRLIKNAQ